MKMITFKLPEKLDAELAASAKQAGMSKSAVARAAIEDRVRRRQPKPALRAYDFAKELAGTVTGPGDLLINPTYMGD